MRDIGANPSNTQQQVGHMRKVTALLAIALLMPFGAAMAASVSINSPGMSIQIGSQDHRGYFWDGYDWREPQWWQSHQGKHKGERNNHGQYWNGSRWDAKPPARRQPVRTHKAAAVQHEAPRANSQQHHDNQGSQEQRSAQGGGDNHPFVKQQ